jgi:putative selenium metabolism protein SsnA
MVTLITNGTIITADDENRILTDHAIAIEGGLITRIEPQNDMLAAYPDALRLSAAGQYVMPGSICAHTHFYGAYARGMAIPGPAPADFPQILQRLWWPLDKALDADSIRASALVCLVDAIRHGTTTLFDHHASPNWIDGSLDVLAAAVESAGVRAVLAYEVTDRDGYERMEAGIAENVRFHQAAKGRPNLSAMFGLHASLTLDDRALRACADAVPDGVGFHIHVAEHEIDELDSLERSGRRVVQRLDEYGIWRANTLAAHAVHIDQAERDLLLARGVWVSHQPRSNMNNGVGAADIDGMLAAGIPVVLGNDGFSNAMWNEWKTAYLLQKVIHRDPRRASGDAIARIALRNNAALATQAFPGAPLGSLQPGSHADLIFVDYHPFTPVTPGNLPWHILFGFESSMVTTTMVAGRVLMRDRVLTTLDEAAIAEEALALAPDVWRRYGVYAAEQLPGESER